MITIAIAHTNQGDRIAITSLLKEQEDFRIVSVGADGYDALRTATIQHPDIIIMDFTMEDIDSLELAPLIKRKSPSTALIVLCPNNEQNAVAKALKAGISGCLFRQDGFTHLVPSIRSVLYGGWYISNSVKNVILNKMAPPLVAPPPIEALPREALPAEVDIPSVSLTPTETGILCGIINGYTDKEIAKNLNIEIGSLRNCVNRLKKRTGLQNRSQMILYALLAGIISLDR